MLSTSTKPPSKCIVVVLYHCECQHIQSRPVHFSQEETIAIAITSVTTDLRNSNENSLRIRLDSHFPWQSNSTHSLSEFSICYLSVCVLARHYVYTDWIFSNKLVCLFYATSLSVLLLVRAHSYLINLVFMLMKIHKIICILFRSRDFYRNVTLPILSLTDKRDFHRPRKEWKERRVERTTKRMTTFWFALYIILTVVVAYFVGCCTNEIA